MLGREKTKRRGRPRQWVLNDEIAEVRKLVFQLKKQDPSTDLLNMKNIVRSRIEENGELANKFDRIWDLLHLTIAFPPRCVCGIKVYTFTLRRVEAEKEHRWEVFARCTNPNCRYLRKYISSIGRWSQLPPAYTEIGPTFYEMDGQMVEEQK